MQAVFTSSTAFNPASRFHFAGGRDYMMRSEKRGSAGSSGSGAPGKRPPRRRRKKAGFFYKLLMLVLLLVLWPVGLIMLWQRKLRWGVSTKLLASVVTLAVSILLIAFALTVNTGNPEYTAIQDKINDTLDIAADSLVDAGEIAAEKAEIVFAGASELGDALWQYGKLGLADAIDAGIALTGEARTTVEVLIDDFMAWVESTGKPAAEETAEPETTEEAEATPEATAEPTPVPTARPIADVQLQSGDTELPIYLPGEGEVIGKGRGLIDGMLYRNGVLEEGPLPTPEATPEPTPEPIHFIIKPASEAIVYYNDGGICYHMASACGSMKTSKAHTFGETAELQHKHCNKCASPNKALLEETYIVWLDGNRKAHLTDECAEFQGKWSLTSAADAIERERTACAACEADRYLAAIAEGKEPTFEAPAPAATPEPTEEPTAEPTEVPTEEPTAEPTEVPTEEPTVEPTEEATAEPTAEPAETAAVEPAAEEIPDAPSPMEIADALSAALVEAMATEAPTAEPTEVPTEAPTAEPTEAPTEVPTEAPTAEPTEAPTEVPTEAPTAEPTEAPTEVPTETPTEVPVVEIVMVTPTATAAGSSAPAAEAIPAEPAASTEPQVIIPTVVVKPAAEATVYHSSNGKWYHTFNRCSGMTGGGAYTLAECVDGYKCCNACGAPKPEMIGQMCLWQDESGICHTADTCAAFQGQYTLVLRDDALAQDLSACEECGAHDYLVPGSILQMPEITPEPTAETNE